MVHFVRQLSRNFTDDSPKPLQFEFRHFLAYYSAHYYLKPEQINIWSDGDEETISKAKLNGDSFTKAVFKIPNVVFHKVDMPNSTKLGFPIRKYAHKSDFVRTRVMAALGGQYFDDDAWVIRDLAPFRKIGFENIFGKQWDNNICQAFWMSTPRNDLMKAFEILQETEFNGDWIRASNILITKLVRNFRGYGKDKNALILERDAFFPGEFIFPC